MITEVAKYSNYFFLMFDMYSPIYNTNDWSPSGDVYVGGTNFSVSIYIVVLHI